MKNPFHAFLSLIRSPNLFVMALLQILLYAGLLNAVYAGSQMKPTLQPLHFALLVLVTVLIAAGGYVINDVFDVEADTLNKPEKVIVGKYMGMNSAINLYYLLNLLAIGLGFFISWKLGSLKLGFIFPFIILMLWLYAYSYKSTVIWGNLNIALLSALVVLIVWLFEFMALKLQPENFMQIAFKLKYITLLFLFYAGFAFLITLAREIVKDIEDREGDQAAGYRTLATVYGQEAARNVALAVIGVAVLMIWLATWWLLRVQLTWTAVYYGGVVAALLITAFLLVRKAGRKIDFARMSHFLKVIMVAGIAGMFILIFTV